ncbi:DSPc domain containing protein [Trichuris trichiura]|uniref:DSPc domain containing protein n=1 Tax=Trichuris trichiura TaxID=36087 RepID=A0A077Z4F8_TRITR|nr:DSPc domain containing protein [Trichuris trichiura]
MLWFLCCCFVGNRSDPNVPSLVTDSTKKDKSYGRVREAFLRVASSDSLCRFFCKGRQCKYCNPALLPDDLKTIDGFYSTWVTDDILAFARPSAVGTEMPELIDKLGKAGIKAIFNLQLPFEHRHCGQPLTEHGFSYDPELFMEQGVAHYNFGWPDFGIIPVNRILNIVKVMQHSLESGGKIAVHCHAGLGRTGMTICCFLIWSKGWTPQEALEYVRKRRQQAVVTDFYNYVESLRPIFDTK